VGQLVTIFIRKRGNNFNKYRAGNVKLREEGQNAEEGDGVDSVSNRLTEHIGFERI